MPIIDLNQLPAPDVVEELDFETILAERKATLISLYPEAQQEAVARTLTLESEPLVKLLEENAYRELIWRQRVNEAARAVMLACAAGNDLDVIGANYNTTRLTITPADDSTIPPSPGRWVPISIMVAVLTGVSRISLSPVRLRPASPSLCCHVRITVSHPKTCWRWCVTP